MQFGDTLPNRISNFLTQRLCIQFPGYKCFLIISKEGFARYGDMTDISVFIFEYVYANITVQNINEFFDKMFDKNDKELNFCDYFDLYMLDDVDRFVKRDDISWGFTMSLIGKCGFETGTWYGIGDLYIHATSPEMAQLMYDKFYKKLEENKMDKPDFIKEETMYTIDHNKIPAGSLVLLTFCKNRKTMASLGFHSNLVNYIENRYQTCDKFISIGGVVGCTDGPDELDMIVCTDVGSFTPTIPATMIASGEVKLEILWKYEEPKEEELL